MPKQIHISKAQDNGRVWLQNGTENGERRSGDSQTSCTFSGCFGVLANDDYEGPEGGCCSMTAKT